MSNQFNNRYQEENAKADQLGGAIAVGCFGLPLAIIVFIFVVVAILE
jgi:hypothetical protein